MRRTGNIVKGGVASIACAAASPASAAVLPTSGLITRLETTNVAAANGAAVSQWVDQFGRGNSGNSAAGFNPTYVAGATPGGKGAFDFDGHYFDVAGGANDAVDFNVQQFTWYVVFKPDADNLSLTAGSGNNQGRPVNSAYGDLGPSPSVTTSAANANQARTSFVGQANSGSTTASYRTGVRSAAGTFASASPGNNSSPAMDATQFYVGGSTWDAASGAVTGKFIFADGTTSFGATATSGAATPQAHVTTRIGGSGITSTAVATPYDGQIAAILIWNRVLTAGEQADVESYLRDTYILPEPATLGAAMVVLSRRRRRVAVE